MEKEDVNEAMRLMEMSRDSLNSNADAHVRYKLVLVVLGKSHFFQFGKGPFQKEKKSTFIFIITVL